MSGMLSNRRQRTRESVERGHRRMKIAVKALEKLVVETMGVFEDRHARHILPRSVNVASAPR